jgi:ankyrin repeat protein
VTKPRSRKLTTRYQFLSTLPEGNYTHATEIVAKIGSKTASKWFKKFDADLPVNIKLYEAYMQNVMRLFERHQPKTVTAKDAHTNVFVLSQAVPGFRSLAQVIIDDGLQAIKDKMALGEYPEFAPKLHVAIAAGNNALHKLDLGTDAQGRSFEQVVIMEGMAAIRDKINRKEYTNFGGMVMSALFVGEVDLHNGNFGLDHRGRFVKIDGDWTLARLRYRSEDSWHANRNYNITPALIKSLPHLEATDYQIHNYGNQIKQRKNTGEEIIPGIDPAIIRTEVNQALLKIILTPNDYLEKLATHEITTPSEDEAMQIAYIEIANRKLQTTISACEDPEFRKYMQTSEAMAYAQSFRDELATYKMTEKLGISDDDNQRKMMLQFEELRLITQLDVKSKEWQQKLITHTQKNLRVDDNLVSPWLETPLHLAAACGNINTVNILLANQANIHAQTSSGHTPIFYAARNGDIDVFSTLLQHGANVLAVGKDGYTPLALAAGNGHLDIVDFLISKKADVNQSTTASQDTALTLAADRNHADVVELLLKNHADPTILNNNQHSALSIAAAKGHTETVKVILNHYRSTQTKPNIEEIEYALLITAQRGHTDTFNTILGLAAGYDNLTQKTADAPTPLMVATVHGHSDIVDSILLLKPDATLLNAKSDDGSTALLLAAKNQHWAIVSLLLNNKHVDANLANNANENVFDLAFEGKQADICATILERNGNIATFRSAATKASILHLAVESDNLALVKDLITKHKMPVDIVDSSGVTPMQLAAMHGRTEITEFLLSNNANVNTDDRKGRTVLAIATINLDLPTIDLLLANKAAVNLQNTDGISALHIAATLGRADILAKFLQSDPTINVNLATNNQVTPLFMAASKGYADAVKFLLDNHANVNAKDNKGNTALLAAADKGFWNIAALLLNDKKIDLRLPRHVVVFILHCAVQDGELDIVKRLIDKKVNPELTDDDGMSALGAAVDNNYLAMTKLLLDKGALIDHVDRNGNTPLLLAAAQGKVDIFIELLARGANTDVKNKHGDTLASIAAVNPDIASALDAHIHPQQQSATKKVASGAAGFNLGLFNSPAVDHAPDSPKPSGRSRSPK